MTLTPSEDPQSNTPPPPRRSGLRRTEEAARAREVGAVDADEVIDGERPVPVAVDTSGLTRAESDRPHATETPDADPLFGQDAAAEFRARWDVVQRSFVDDPRQAVRAGDELVTQVIDALSRTFADQRTEFEKEGGPDPSSTETLRLALRRYRSFFERLLTI